MTSRDLGERITEQFSGRGDRADIWRGFDRFLDTDRFLNLGYSRWYQPHVVGSSQERLAGVVGDQLASVLGEGLHGRRLLDVGCGRGGPATVLADRFGFDVTGVDLVPHNVALASDNARTQGSTASFVVGDATALPIAAESMTACIAIDALVYVPDRATAISQLAATLVPDGALVITDLVRRPGLSPDAKDAVDAFADAWDMPSLGTAAEYRRLLAAADLDVRTLEPLTPHSVGRFRRWTTLYLAITATPLRALVDHVLERYGLDPASIQTQIRRAHDALPHLEHVLFVAQK